MNTTMHNPPHPGEILRHMYVQPLNITVTEMAKKLGITRQALSDLINCHAGISVEMSIRLSKAFDTNPEYWLNLQNKRDLWMVSQSRKKDFAKIHRISATTS